MGYNWTGDGPYRWRGITRDLHGGRRRDRSCPSTAVTSRLAAVLATARHSTAAATSDWLVRRKEMKQWSEWSISQRARDLKLSRAILLWTEYYETILKRVKAILFCNNRQIPTRQEVPVSRNWPTIRSTKRVNHNRNITYRIAIGSEDQVPVERTTNPR